MKGDFSMVKLYDGGVYLVNGREIVTDAAALPSKCGRTVTKEEAEQGTIAYGILKAHNKSGDMQNLRMRFDSLTSHDITYVGIIQTARASGMKEFPMPYVLTNCHNSLCAVGGTINEDDHMFALSAAHKYGGIYVPTNMAVIHSYNREMMSGCGRMILGSDSHTRYGALGTLAKNWNPVSASRSETFIISFACGLWPFSILWRSTNAAHLSSSARQSRTDLRVEPLLVRRIR